MRRAIAVLMLCTFTYGPYLSADAAFGRARSMLDLCETSWPSGPCTIDVGEVFTQWWVTFTRPCS